MAATTFDAHQPYGAYASHRREALHLARGQRYVDEAGTGSLPLISKIRSGKRRRIADIHRAALAAIKRFRSRGRGARIDLVNWYVLR